MSSKCSITKKLLAALLTLYSAVIFAGSDLAQYWQEVRFRDLNGHVVYAQLAHKKIDSNVDDIYLGELVVCLGDKTFSLEDEELRRLRFPILNNLEQFESFGVESVEFGIKVPVYKYLSKSGKIYEDMNGTLTAFYILKGKNSGLFMLEGEDGQELERGQFHLRVLDKHEQCIEQ